MFHNIILITVLLLTGCNGLFIRGLEPNVIRAALEECREFDLDTLVYNRPDGSVFSIRCIPKPDQVTKYVTVRPRVPMRILRPLMSDQSYTTDNDEIIIKVAPE